MKETIHVVHKEERRMMILVLPTIMAQKLGASVGVSEKSPPVNLALAQIMGGRKLTMQTQALGRLPVEASPLQEAI